MVEASFVVLLLVIMGVTVRNWPAGALPPKARARFIVKPQLISLYDLLFGNEAGAEVADNEVLEFEIIEDEN